jgi:hypothetical protein
MRHREGARRMKLANKDWLDVPVIALLAANAVPLFGVLFLGSPAPLLVALVALKTILDVNLHNREHKKARAKT